MGDKTNSVSVDNSGILNYEGGTVKSISNSGTINMSYDKTITADSFTNNGTLSVNMSGATLDCYSLVKTNSSGSSFGTVNIVGVDKDVFSAKTTENQGVVALKGSSGEKTITNVSSSSSAGGVSVS